MHVADSKTSRLLRVFSPRVLQNKKTLCTGNIIIFFNFYSSKSEYLAVTSPEYTIKK